MNLPGLHMCCYSAHVKLTLTSVLPALLPPGVPLVKRGRNGTLGPPLRRWLT